MGIHDASRTARGATGKPSLARATPATSQSTCKGPGELSIRIRILASTAGPPRLLSRNLCDSDLHVRLCASDQSRLDRSTGFWTDDIACVECGLYQSQYAW